MFFESCVRDVNSMIVGPGGLALWMENVNNGEFNEENNLIHLHTFRTCLVLILFTSTHLELG